MTKSFRICVGSLTQKIKSFIEPTSLPELKSFDNADYIKKFNELKIVQGNISSLLIPTGGIITIIEHGEHKYVVLIGTKLSLQQLSEITFINEQFPVDEENDYKPDVPTFLFLIHEFNRFIEIRSEYKNNKLNLIDKLVDGITISDYMGFYEDIFLFQIDKENFMYDYSLYRIAIEFFCNIESLRYLNSSKNSENNLQSYLNNIKLLVDKTDLDDKKINFFDIEFILNSLSSLYWKNAFLELYKCLEALYWIPHTYAYFVEKNNSSKKLEYSDYHEISQSFNWEYKEKDSIEKLIEMIFFKYLSDTSGNLIKNITALESDEFSEFSRFIKINPNTLGVFNTVNNTVNSNTNNKKSITKIATLVAKDLYSYRNSLVHHKDRKYGKISLTEENCEDITLFMLQLLLQFYKYFQNKIKITE